MNKYMMSFALLCVVFSSAVAQQKTFDVEKTSDRLYEYLRFRKTDVPKKAQIEELNEIEESIDSELNANPADPMLWWLKGLTAWSFVHALQEPLSDEERSLKKYYKHELTDRAFRKAIELDRGDNNALPLDVYYSLRTFGSSDVHVAAVKKIISLEPDLEESEEIELRGGMIVQLLRLERYEEVMRQVDIIERKYPDSEYSKQARARFGELMASKNARSVEKEDRDENPIQGPDLEGHYRESPSDLSRMAPKPLPEQKSTSYSYWLLGIAIAIIFATFVIRIRRKRRPPS